MYPIYSKYSDTLAKALSRIVPDHILIFFIIFPEKIRLSISCESSAALFFSVK